MPIFIAFKSFPFFFRPQIRLLLDQILYSLSFFLLNLLRLFSILILFYFLKIIQKFLFIDHEDLLRNVSNILRANFFLSAVIYVQFDIMLWKLHSVSCPMHRYLLIWWLNHVFVNLRLYFVLYYGGTWLSIEIIITSILHPRIRLNVWWVYLLDF